MGSHFSNHTEFDMWEANWCDRCLVDHPFRSRGVGHGCRILAAALISPSIDVLPPEWFKNDEPYPWDVTCIEFKPFGYRRPGPPVPCPPPPGQGTLDFTPSVPASLHPSHGRS